MNTPKHFVLQLGSLLSLYLSLAFFLTLVFALINLMFPDSAEGVWQIERAASSIRLGFAMVVVFLPTYLVLTRLVNQQRRTSSMSEYTGLTKWLIYLSLLVGSFVLLGNLVTVIMGFLEGELTSRFLLKAASVFLVIGSALTYYILDARGYWLQAEKKSLVYAGVLTTAIVAIMVVALTTIPNPSTVRVLKADQQVVSDLQDMQYRIEDYYRANDTLPPDLATIYGEFPVPTPPAERAPYNYNVTGELSYELCGTFAYDVNETGVDPLTTFEPSLARPGSIGNYNWDYQAGDWCFDRVIDEEFRR